AGGAGVALTALAAVCVVPRATRVEAQAVAQQAPPESTGPSRRRLFDATEPLELTLKSDFGAVAKERGTEKKGQPGVLSYAATTGDSVVLDVHLRTRGQDRKSTRLNSSHVASSYAAFCLKKKRSREMS